MRLCTTRNAEINKNVELKYANRVSDVPAVSEYGDEQYEYGDIQSIFVCVMPFKTEVEAKAYGVSLLGGRKATLTVEQASLFNEFTHIWVDKEPDSEGQDSEFYVKDNSKTLNGALLILEKKDGSDAGE